jgi:PKD repeat protein
VATGSSSPSHLYGTAGQFAVKLDVTSPLGSTSAGLPVTVTSGVLSVGLAATPSIGPAPLTVHFVADVSGGSGTYASILWSFGDGGDGTGADLLYTYATSGVYVVRVNVTDESGSVASATSSVTVVPNGSGPSGGGPSGAALSPLTIAAAAAATAALVAVALYWAYAVRPSRIAYDRRTLRTVLEERPTPSGVTTPRATTAAGAIATTPERRSSRDTAGKAPRPKNGEPVSAQRLSERMLSHLLWNGRTDTQGVPRLEATQEGMASALGVGQNTISKVASRLVAAGVLRAELLHVPGAVRRVKVYTLTPRGEAFARTLRSPRPDAPSTLDP